MENLIYTFFLVLFRVSGFMLVAPLFSHKGIPLKIRAIILAVLSISLSCMVLDTDSMLALNVSYFFAIIQNALIGFLIGWLLYLPFEIIHVFGECISFQSGLHFASMNDPQSHESHSVLSQWLSFLGLAIFLSLDGHLAVLELLKHSFYFAPLSATPALVIPEWSDALLWLKQLFITAVSIAFPYLIVMLMLQLGFGYMSKSMGQLNLLSLSFPLTLGACFFMLAASFYPLAARLETLWQDYFGQAIHYFAGMS